MTRADHIAWCKRRALEYVERGDLVNAINSMISDLGKHSETEDHIGIRLGATRLLGGRLNDATEVRRWIEGFA